MSDHISGPRALAEPIADITDVYAFPSPERSGQLVLVMNTLPFAQPSDLFSDGLVYRFRLRPLTPGAASDPAPFTVAEEELVFDCVFSAPTVDETKSVAQEGTCFTPRGETVSFGLNDERGGSADGVRVFAGPRWDPFIMDAPAALKTIATGTLAFTDPGAIYLDGKNVLSLVVEFDCSDVLNGVQLVWAVDGNGIHPLTELVLADYLVVDVTKPYADQGSFFEIERATREGRAHETCGGRAPNDDVMDTIFTLLVNAANGPVIRDGVDRATTPASHTFPYLAPPNPKPPEPPEHL